MYKASFIFHTEKPERNPSVCVQTRAARHEVT
jgi:hypothetical protein